MKKILIAYYIVLSIIFLRGAVIGAYNCGEMEGQATQYSYSTWFEGFGGYKDNSEYIRLNQYSGENFNPFCRELFSFYFRNLIGFFALPFVLIAIYKRMEKIT